jgi:hypothetical protein
MPDLAKLGAAARRYPRGLAGGLVRPSRDGLSRMRADAASAWAALPRTETVYVHLWHWGHQQLVSPSASVGPGQVRQGQVRQDRGRQGQVRQDRGRPDPSRQDRGRASCRDNSPSPSYRPTQDPRSHPGTIAGKAPAGLARQLRRPNRPAPKQWSTRKSLQLSVKSAS